MTNDKNEHYKNETAYRNLLVYITMVYVTALILYISSLMWTGLYIGVTCRTVN
jgi:hypothetical protein